ncbi:MAG: hypothetical protein ACRYFR_14490 [Janthinobacterium lividum]
MPHFLPDAESITDYCGAYEACGCQFKVVRVGSVGGYGLRMDFGPGSTVLPIFPLPADEMQTPEAAQQWMEHLRDKHLSQFNYMLRGR